MKKLLSFVMIVLVLSTFVSCNKKSSSESKLNDSISLKAGAYVGSQIAASILGDSVNGSKVDLDAFYNGFASVFKCDTTDRDMSYMGGVQMAFRTFQMLGQMGIDIENLDRGRFLREFKKMLASKQALPLQQLQANETELNDMVTRLLEVKASDNRKAGAAYMAKRAKEKGFVKTASGIMYRVIKEGEGETFKETDLINVLYKGQTIDGNVFDQTDEGQPRPMSPQQVVPGFSEMLKLMKPGMKVEVIIPDKLAYGAQGNQDIIEPGATIVFELETVGVAEAPQMPQGQPQIVPVQ